MQRRIYQLIVELEEERNDVSLRIENEQAKQKQVYDQQGISEKLKIGDQVLVERTWLKNNFLAKLENKNLDGKLVKHVIHGNRLKKYHERRLEPIVII
ncbi:unnamed protein product [Rhizophagus irregularis]|nr:unnamed protein product [Rhizophagus irregularis]